ncbi:MAG: recombinase family protein [Planctomycetales bacterium]|nr:recombinase family protein [Planctomycetales bacterium]
MAATRAVGYLRRSTKKQEDSLEIQRELIHSLANEYSLQVEDWYIDDGITGGKDSRPEFQRMIRDAEANAFDVLFARSRSRLSRLGHHRHAYYLSRLEEAGVRIITVDDGELEINDFGAFVKESASAYSDAKYLEDLSKLTIGGQVQRAVEGFSAGQLAPYGYDRMYVDRSTGEHVQRMKRGDGCIKNPKWRTTFVPSENTQEVETVKWIFNSYAESLMGFRGIAEDLNGRAVPSPTGGTWHQGTVRAILKNEKYVGDYVWNKRREGKYGRVVQGRAVSRSRKETRGDTPRVLRNERDDYATKKNAHEGLVSREVFNICQEKMQGRKTHQGVVSPSSDKHLYLLSGKVKCGECGGNMHGKKTVRRKKDKVYEYRHYLCATYDCRGANQCKHNRVRHDDIHQIVVRELATVLRESQNVERLEHLVQERLKQLGNPPNQKAGLQRELQQIQKQINRLLDLPNDLADLAIERLRDLKNQKEAIETKIAASTAAPKELPSVSKIMEGLAKLESLLLSADQRQVHLALQRLIDHVELHFRPVNKGKRHVQELEHGVIFLAQGSCPVEQVAGARFELTTSRL